MDTVASETRSRIMSRIRSTGNKSTERRLRAHLVRLGIRAWRMHAKDVLGRPDFLFDSAKLAVFVNGCFWHGCWCSRLPQSRIDYWHNKIARNKARDRRIYKTLTQEGWSVLHVWEHELHQDAAAVVAKIVRRLHTVIR